MRLTALLPQPDGELPYASKDFPLPGAVKYANAVVDMHVTLIRETLDDFLRSEGIEVPKQDEVVWLVNVAPRPDESRAAGALARAALEARGYRRISIEYAVV